MWRLSILLLFLYPGTTLYSQDLPEMVFIEGKSFTMGGGYQYKTEGLRMIYLGEDQDYSKISEMNGQPLGVVQDPNNPVQNVTGESFYIARQEVSNLDYKYFLADSLLGPEEAEKLFKSLGKIKSDSVSASTFEDRMKQIAIAAELWPHTQCWSEPYTLNSPYEYHYFQHPAFDDYPLVGITWDQARVYCDWLTRQHNEERRKKGKPELPPYRLPSELEWEMAASGEFAAPEWLFSYRNYPWFEDKPVNRDGVQDRKGNYRANIKTGPNGDYWGDWYMITNPVDMFEQTNYKLCNIAGNVSEWTSDNFRPNEFESENITVRADDAPELSGFKVAKGGSWADLKYASMCGSRTGFDPEMGHSRVGFRVARSAK